MSRTKQLMIASLLGFLLASCSDESVESASEHVEDVRGEVDDMIDKVHGEGVFEETAESIGEGADAVADEAKDAAERLKKATEQ